MRQHDAPAVRREPPCPLTFISAMVVAPERCRVSPRSVIPARFGAQADVGGWRLFQELSGSERGLRLSVSAGQSGAKPRLQGPERRPRLLLHAANNVSNGEVLILTEIITNVLWKE